MGQRDSSRQNDVKHKSSQCMRSTWPAQLLVRGLLARWTLPFLDSSCDRQISVDMPLWAE